MDDVKVFYMCIAWAILFPLTLLTTGNIDKRQYFGWVQLHLLVLFVAYVADRV